MLDSKNEGIVRTPQTIRKIKEELKALISYGLKRFTNGWLKIKEPTIQYIRTFIPIKNGKQS